MLEPVHMENLLRYFCLGRDYENVRTALQKGMKEQLIAGLNGSARTLFISALFAEHQTAQLVVTHNLHQAQKMYDDLVEWVGEESVALFPVNELISSEMSTASPELSRERIRVLESLTNGQKKIVVAPLAAIKRILSPPSIWEEARFSLSVGDDLEIAQLQKQLLYLGYKRVEMVESEGEYSIRGGILDLFPPTQIHPVRVELFDTVIDSIRFFDLETQKSKKKQKQVIVSPAVEWVLYPDHYHYATDQIQAQLKQQLKRMTDENRQVRLQENIASDIERFKQESMFAGIYKYISCFYGHSATLLDYFDHEAIVLFDEPTRIMETEENLMVEERQWKTSMLEDGQCLPDLKLNVSLHDWKMRIRQPLLYLSLFLRKIPHSSPENIVQFTSKPMQTFYSQWEALKLEIERWEKSKQVIVFMAGDEERAKRLARVLEDFGISTRRMTSGKEAPLRGIPLIKVGSIASGFELPLHQLTVVAEHELFVKKQTKKRVKHKQDSNAQRIKSYNELEPNDYVVHINHGIGQYVGIETLELEGAHKDYLYIRYAKDDKLYVPVEQIDQVQKFISGEEKTPKLYNLGSNEWKKVKSRVKASVQDIAENLIKLYAKREMTKGYGYSEDHEMQREFEAMFTYQETDDQLQSIDEIKADMELPRPMDRLLCGDVGYGKTEVAIRSAFKAIMDGKQVAVLVPTTILAQQHFETFKERFHDFPVTIDVLSRFRSRKEQRQTIKGIKQGIVDIVIGTHRILSKDLEFKDLGLLVVDEEQRFGVSHKEKIKQLKENVDVLTLTATPIPRTLHMSMLGVRDLSVIETPPENRYPVQTYVLEYSTALVREVIERELARDGQVYFLYNRVEGIESKANEIQALVPDARVAVAHGQMRESELEAIMISFLNDEYDVLVSTTIIESGVDIPNVNTLIIHDADKMGLSQLYQLRGRVGRSNRTAYAYLTYQRGKVLTEVAEKRLQAIKEFTELGSGFKIAMRDLAIRGAGNLLGAEQHGHINSVGFDLYSQMLAEAVNELRGEKDQTQKNELILDVHIDAYIPDIYIADSKQKIEMYKKVAAITTTEEAVEVEEELVDRYGSLPDSVLRLLKLARLKAYAIQLGMESITLKNHVLKLMFNPFLNDKINGSKLFSIASQLGRQVGLISDTQIGVQYRIKGQTEDEWLTRVEQMLKQFIEDNVVRTEGMNTDDENTKQPSISEGQSTQVS